MAIKNSLKYSPMPPPQGGDIGALTTWVTREFQRLSAALDNVHDLELESTGPSKPQDGMMRYADGTYWNPDSVSGQGFYGYWDNAWHFFGGSGGGGGGGSVVYGSAIGLANTNVDGVETDVSRSDHQHKRDVRVAKAGTDVGTRNRLNFIEGAAMTVTVADDSTSDEIDVTIACDGVDVAKGGVSAGTQSRINLIEGSGVGLTVADDPTNSEIDITVTALGGRQSVWVPAHAMTVRTNAGCGVGLKITSNYIMLSTLNFDSSITEYAQFTIQMPDSWDEGIVNAKFIWSHGAASTNFGVAWALQGVATTDGATLNNSFGTAQLALDTGGTEDYCYISPETDDITIAGTPTGSNFVVFQIYRKHDDSSDTLATDARLHGVMLLYTVTKTNDD